MTCSPRCAALAGLISTLGCAAGAQGLPFFQNLPTGPYRVVVTSVDTTEFPRVELEYKVYAQDPDAPRYDPSMTTQAFESVPGGEERPGEIVEPPDVCRIDDVVMGVAVDVSGSVSGVLEEIKQGAQEMFQEMLGSGQQDAGALYAFSDEVNWRRPEGGSYSTDIAGLVQAAGQIPQGGGSPIFKSMAEEITRLVAYRPPPNPDPEVRAIKVLATLTDGADNASSPADYTRIVAQARAGDVLLVNLGYGSVAPQGLLLTALASGGVFVDGIDGRIKKVLGNILHGARHTYCLTYLSPHPEVVNEPARALVEVNGSRGSSRYPLPFLIPEDSRGLNVFMPVSDLDGQFFQMTGQFPRVRAALDLVDEAGEPWEPGAGEIDRQPRGDAFELGRAAWRQDETGGWGFVVPVPTDLLHHPTDRVVLATDADGETDYAVDHIAVTAEYLPGFGMPEGRRYTTPGRLSVQDRTPPQLLVRVRPQDGGPVYEARLVEERAHQDPGLVPDGWPRNPHAHGPGVGRKAARIDFRWRDPEGEELAGTLPDLGWSVAGEELPGPVELVEGGRAEIVVLARDGWALLENSIEWPDRDAWTEHQPDPARGAIYSWFDTTRHEAQGESASAPFFPRVDMQTLRDAPDLPGVTWWIESPDDPGDRLAGFEGIQWVHYGYPDSKLGGEGPFHFLRVYAQDGLGHSSALVIPLLVHDSDFGSRRIRYRTRRRNYLD